MATPKVLVLHTTEGSSFSGAKSWLTQKNTLPHYLVDPKEGIFEQLLPLEKPGRALRNLSGGVETNNRDHVYQIEIVGKAAEVPHYADAWYRQLGIWVSQICAETGVPLVMPYRFAGSSAYGIKGAVRLTNAEWLAASGIIGHQHVPENTHWDPGNIIRLGDFLKPKEEVKPVVEKVEKISKTSAKSYIKIGAKGVAVQQLQAKLSITVDGDFGPLTEAALKAFQAAQGLPPNGRHDATTWARIHKPETLRPITTAKWVTRLSGDVVATWQYHLGLPVTGKINGLTRAATAGYQTGTPGLKVDGVLGAITWGTAFKLV